MVAGNGFDPEDTRKDLAETKQVCERNGCPTEFILKDISTFRKDPSRLEDWGRVAMEVAES